MNSKKENEKVIDRYIKGELSISEARKLLNYIEAKRIVNLIDHGNFRNK